MALNLFFRVWYYSILLYYTYYIIVLYYTYYIILYYTYYIIIIFISNSQVMKISLYHIWILKNRLKIARFHSYNTIVWQLHVTQTAPFISRLSMASGICAKSIVWPSHSTIFPVNDDTSSVQIYTCTHIWMYRHTFLLLVTLRLTRSALCMFRF